MELPDRCPKGSRRHPRRGEGAAGERHDRAFTDGHPAPGVRPEEGELGFRREGDDRRVGAGVHEPVYPALVLGGEREQGDRGPAVDPRFQALRAILPLVAPGIGAFVVLCILFAWNDYLFAAIIGSGGAKTLPAATRELVQPQNIQWGQIMAAGVVTTLPMMLLGLVIRKYLVTGLTMGAVKE